MANDYDYDSFKITIKRRKKLGDYAGTHPSQMSDKELEMEATMLLRKLERVLDENQPLVQECISRAHGDLGATKEQQLGELLKAHKRGFEMVVPHMSRPRDLAVEWDN